MLVCDICRKNKPNSKINISQALHYPANYELCANCAHKVKNISNSSKCETLKTERSKNADKI